jgi:hypothetical protein
MVALPPPARPRVHHVIGISLVLALALIAIRIPGTHPAGAAVWTTQEVLASSVANSTATQVYMAGALDATGTAYLGWRSGSGLASNMQEIKIAKRTAGGWVLFTSFNGAQVFATPGLGVDEFVSDTSFKFDSSGNIHLSVHAQKIGACCNQQRGIVYAKYTASTMTWSFEAVQMHAHPNGFQDSFDSSIGLTSTGVPYIVLRYNDAGPHTDVLRIASRATGTWVVTDLDTATSPQQIGDPNFVVDGADKFHISYRRRNASSVDDLVYINNVTGSWSAQQTVSAGGSANPPGPGNAIAVDAAGKAHIAFVTTFASGSDLKHATNVSGSWVVSPVDGDGTGTAIRVGAFMSITQNSAGMQLIGYSASNTTFDQAVKAAHRTGAGAWTIDTVDPTPDSGGIAIAALLATDGKATIGYQFNHPDDNTRKAMVGESTLTGGGGGPTTTVSSIVRASANPTSATTVDFTVTFADSVTGVTSGNFGLTTTGVMGASVGTTMGSGATWTVSVNTGTRSGTIRLDFNNSMGMSHTVTNAPFTTGQEYMVVKDPPTIMKSFTPAQIPVGSTSVLRLTLTNPNASLTLSDVAVTDPLPMGVAVHSTPGVMTTCTGTISATAGGNTISLMGGTLAGGAACIIDVTVVGNTFGVKTNTTMNVSATESGPGTTAMATLTVVGPPTFSKSFVSSTIAKGTTSQLEFVITNPNTTVELTGITFTDTLPVGLSLTSATTANVCGMGSSLVVDATMRTIQLTGGRIAAGAMSCTFPVTVTGTTEGNYPNSATAIAMESGTNSATAMATLKVFAPPTVMKSFMPATIKPNETSTLTITITNPMTNPGGLNGIGIIDMFPAGFEVHSTPAAMNSCMGMFNPMAMATTITLTGGSIAAAGATCAISVTVKGTMAGQHMNTTQAVTSNEGGSGLTATATLSVYQPPTIMKSFAPATITIGKTSVLRLDISNPNPSPLPLSAIAVTDMLPVGIEIHTVPAVSNTCGGTVMAQPTGTTISLTGASLSAGAMCTVQVTVRGTLLGMKTNTTGNITAMESGPGLTASATLTMTAPPGGDGNATSTGDTGGGIIPVGQPFSFTFVVSNNTATPATQSTLQITLPTGIMVSGIVFRRGGVVIPTNTMMGPYCNGPTAGKLACVLGPLGAQDAITVQVNATRWTAPPSAVLCAQGVSAATINGVGYSSATQSCAR